MYIRFGDLPEDGMSKIWRGEECVGEEQGVSVYDAHIDEWGEIQLCLPIPFTKDTIDTLCQLVKYSDRPCYLVNGHYIGKGSDNEPVISNVVIVDKLEIRKK